MDRSRGPGKLKRKYCKLRCTKLTEQNVRSLHDTKIAKRVIYFYKDCPGLLGFCPVCFNEFHKK